MQIISFFFGTFRFLYIDIERTALTLMSSSELETFKSESGIELGGSVGENKMEFCLTGQVTTSITANPNTNNELSEKENVEKNLLNHLSATNLLSGGHLSCKYCVEKCPKN